MDAKTLRASILQMAIEGKLVPQLDEEPAVEQIGEAPEDVPFSIPDKWKWVSLESVCSLIKRGKSPTYVESSAIPVIAQKCNQWDGLYINKAKFIDPKTLHKYSEELRLAELDILVNSTGVGTLGRIGIFKATSTTPKILVWDSHITVLRSIAEKMDPWYLYYYLRNPSVQNEIEEISDGSTKQKELSTKTLKAYLFPLPPIGEQRRIVARLNELLPLVDKFGKAQEAMAVAQKEFPEKLKASLLQEAIQGKLVPQLDEEPAVEQIGEAPEDVPFAIPEKWKWVQCKDVVTFNPRIQAQDETEASFIPMTAVSAGFASTIDTSAIKPWKQIKNGFSKFSNGDVLFSKITPCFQNRKSVVCKNLSNEIGAGSTEFHVLRPSKKLLADFLLFFLKSPYLIKYGVENLRGTAGQQRFSTADLKTCLFPLPPIEEQRRIVTRLNELLLLVTKLATTTVK